MTDLFEPLRRQLRERGWRQVQRWNQTIWQRPGDDGLFSDDEALRQLERLEAEEQARKVE